MYDFVKYDRLPVDLPMSKGIKTHHQEYIIEKELCVMYFYYIKNEQNQQIYVLIEFRSQIMKMDHDLKHQDMWERSKCTTRQLQDFF